MSVRDLTTIVLRLIAVGLIFSAAGVLLASFIGMSQIPYTPNTTRSVFGSMLLFSGPRFGIGVALFIFAPLLAILICRDNGPETDQLKIESVGPGDIYRIACFVLGILILLSAVGPASRAAVELVARETLPSKEAVAGLVDALVRLTGGVVLVFGARGLAKFISNLGYDPDNIPAQQFTLRMMLFVVVGFAVLLGIIRALVR